MATQIPTTINELLTQDDATFATTAEALIAHWEAGGTDLRYGIRFGEFEEFNWDWVNRRLGRLRRAAERYDRQEMARRNDVARARSEQRAVGRSVLTCTRCGETGLSGSFPFTCHYAGGLCDDCGA